MGSQRDGHDLATELNCNSHEQADQIFVCQSKLCSNPQTVKALEIAQ